jgi:exodeoxyribonuclease X
MDVETTGFDPDLDAVVEIAGAEVVGRKVVDQWDHLVNPGRLIPPEAMGVHHILDRHVVERPSLGEVLRDYVLPLMPFVPVAHNWEFDGKFLGLHDMDAICTWRCANHLWPDCPSFSNQTLRYWLKLFKEPEPRAMPPHRATSDVWVTANILLRMLRERTVDQLIELTEAPILLRKVRFGKHRGELWSEVPRDYCKWILRAGDFDRDVTHTARHYS